MDKKSVSNLSLIMATTSLLLAVVQAIRMLPDNTVLIRLIALGQVTILLAVLLLLLRINEIFHRR